MNQSTRLASLALALLVPSPGLLAAVPSPLAQDAPVEATAEDYSKIGTEAWLADVRLKLEVDGGGSMKSFLQSEIFRLVRLLEGREKGPSAAEILGAALRLEDQLSAIQGPDSDSAPAEVQVNGNSIRDTVESALRRNDRNLVNQMGPSIVHVLEAILLEMEHPAENGPYVIAPLERLVDLDPASGMATARVLLTRKQKGWPTIVANACSRRHWLRGLTSAEELVQSDAYAVVLQLQSAAEVSPSVRAELLVPFLRAGVRNEELSRAARAVSGELMGIDEFASDATRWLQDEWLQEPDPELRLRTAAWLAELEPGMDQLEQMLDDASPSVRSHVPRALHMGFVRSGRVSPRASELWSRLLKDSEPQVRQALYSAIKNCYQSNRTNILSGEQLQELFHLLGSPVEREAAGGLLTVLDRDLWSRKDQESFPQTMAVLFQSSLPDVAPGLAKALQGARGNPRIIAELIDRIDWTRDWGKRSDNLKQYSERDLYELPIEERLVWMARWIQRPAMPAQFLQDLMRDKGSRDSFALEVLPASDAVSVLLHEKIRAGVWLRGMLHGTDWTWAQAELEAAVNDANNTPDQVLLARMALVSLPGATDATRAGLVADLMAPNVDAMEATEKKIGALLTGLTPKVSPARRRMFLDLLAEPAVPSAILHQFYSVDLGSTSVSDGAMETILDRLGERLAKVGSQPEPLFIGVANDSLGRMLQNPELFREGLVREWTRNASQFSAGARVAQAAGRGDMIPAMRNHLIRAMEETPSNANYYLEQVFSVEDQGTLQAMVSLAYSTTSAVVRDGILARIRTRAEMMELEAQLSPSAKGPTREDALAELVSMLDDPSEVVRVEAIRSIATMDAVEYLPRLIAFLSSDSKAEREAARIALDTLHNKAARKE